MLETNIRVVRPGTALYVCTRLARVAGSNVTPDLLQRACGVLQHRHGCAAIPVPGQSMGLLVATERPIEPVHLEGEDWELDVTDADEPPQRLAFTDPDGPDLIARLLERALLTQIARQKGLWKLDSPRIWYEAEPCRTQYGIAAYRRYEIAAQPIAGVGVGLAVDVGTAFFSVESLAYYFDPAVSEGEQRRRKHQFEQLSGRQESQKGTLLYDNSRSRLKCYFESAPTGVTCATTGRVRAKGQSFPSLTDYYRATYPTLSVSADAPAVRVSFPGIDRPQFVAAERVRLRVMNDDVPDALGSVAKVKPGERRDLIEQFWSRLGSRPLGSVAPGMLNGFWRPDAERIAQLPPPDLLFGQDMRLRAPKVASVEAYRANYRQRLECIEEAGCHSVPVAMARTLHCAYPKRLGEVMCRRFATDVANALGDATGLPVVAELIGYDIVTDAVEKLKATGRKGIVLFVLNREPTAYYEAAYHLPGWRLKRVTERALTEHTEYVERGVWDRRKQAMSPALGKRRWRDFVTMNALDVLQLLDVVPFGVERIGAYDAQVAIDVGHDRRHFSLSLLIARAGNRSPAFRIVSHVHPKTDYQHETINATMLADQLIHLFEAALPSGSDPIESLVVLRDGRLLGAEIQGIDAAVARLVAAGRVSASARIDLAELHKDTLKSLRMWEIDAAGVVENPLEGSMIRLNDATAVVVGTGAATLTQGTSEPYLVIGNGRCSSVADVAASAFAGAQLNWSSPRVAQRLPLTLKRTDEELKARAAQEIRRLR